MHDSENIIGAELRRRLIDAGLLRPRAPEADATDEAHVVQWLAKCHPAQRTLTLERGRAPSAIAI